MAVAATLFTNGGIMKKLKAKRQQPLLLHLLLSRFNQIFVLISAVEAKKRRVADGKLKAESAMAAAATLCTNGGIMKKLKAKRQQVLQYALLL